MFKKRALDVNQTPQGSLVHIGTFCLQMAGTVISKNKPSIGFTCLYIVLFTGLTFLGQLGDNPVHEYLLIFIKNTPS